MPQIVELQDQVDGVLYGDGKSKYRGPPPDYPFQAFKVLGGLQLTNAIILLVIAFVHVTLKEEDRGIFLTTGAILVWAPLFGLASGTVGVFVSHKRYWEAECLRIGFLITCWFAFAAHVALVALVAAIEAWYYGFIDEKYDPLEMFPRLGQRLEFEDDNEEYGYLSMLLLIFIFAGLQVLVTLIGACLACCCAYTYEPDNNQVVVKQVGAGVPLKQRAPVESNLGRPSELAVEGYPFTTAIGQAVSYDNPQPVDMGYPEPAVAYEQHVVEEPQEYVYVEKPYLYDPRTNLATPLEGLPQVIPGSAGSFGGFAPPHPAMPYMPPPPPAPPMMPGMPYMF